IDEDVDGPLPRLVDEVELLVAVQGVVLPVRRVALGHHQVAERLSVLAAGGQIDVATFAIDGRGPIGDPGVEGQATHEPDLEAAVVRQRDKSERLGQRVAERRSDDAARCDLAGSRFHGAASILSALRGPRTAPPEGWDGDRCAEHASSRLTGVGTAEEGPEMGVAGRTLFTRQSSGLVREVSVVNALFFNTAAFIGGGVGGYPAFYALAFLPVGLAGGISTYAWAAIIVGGLCVILGMIFASLTSVMPRSG